MTDFNTSEIEVKKALKKNYFVDPLFGAMYTLSPYMNCSHKCIYCDGRAEKYHLEGEFGNNITVRRNIVDLLSKELPLLRENAPIHLSSGISDVYQHTEKKQNLTGRCSELLAEHNFNVSVLTKSSLVLRDIDTWNKVNKKGGFTLQMSFTTLDDNIRKLVEPGASSVSERLETIKAFKDIGCSIGIYMMPLLPGITDDLKGIKQTLDVLQDLKVDYIMPSTLTLRPGRQKDIYMSMIESHFPELKSLYSNLYRENRPSGVPIKAFEDVFYKNITGLFSDINFLMPHKLYSGKMPIYCEILVLLQHMVILYDSLCIDTKRLRSSLNRIKLHFKNEKIRFNRKRNLPSDEIDHQFEFLIKTGGLNNIIQNEKLCDFIETVVLNKRLFDYQNMKLD